MNQTLNNKSKTHSTKQVTNVRLDWRDGRASDEAWNETCAWAIEHYGLPGVRYTWHPTEDYMDFRFYNEKDAIHFSLRWL